MISGRSEIDQSLITGETLPKTVAVGSPVYAGTLVRTGVLRVRVSAASEATLLSEISRLLENAQQARSRYVRLAERASRLYAPVVHAAALLTMIGWLIAGASLHDAVVTAIAVLIITCPCALGLAIPAAQTVASGALFGSGVLLNSGDAIERMAAVDHVIFDKTGTLTLPELDVYGGDSAGVPRGRPRCAVEPFTAAAAVARAAKAASPLAGFQEEPGWRVPGVLNNGSGIRLGRLFDRGAEDAGNAIPSRDPEASVVAFRHGSSCHVFAVRFVSVFTSPPSSRAPRRGIGVEIVSGDREPAVRAAAQSLGISNGAPKSHRSTRSRGSMNWHVRDSRY